MKAIFRGNGKDDPAGVTLGGVWFPMGEAVEVPAAWQVKIAGNTHFEIVADQPEATDERATLVARAAALGIEIDGRWGVKRLRAAVEAGHGTHEP